jgi:hypothetical protein
MSTTLIEKRQVVDEGSKSPRDEADAYSEGFFVVVGLTAVVFSGLYFLSDVIELIQGGFSTPQLVLTLAAEAAVPFFVIGLYLLQRPRIGNLGLVGTIAYAYTFVFFTGTVVYALANTTRNWDQLVDQLGPWMTIHGVLMVVAGLAFGIAVVRAGVFPRWTGATLMAGVVIIAASSGLSDLAQTAAATIRDLAFAGMGVSLLVRRRVKRTTSRRSVEATDVTATRRAS